MSRDAAVSDNTMAVPSDALLVDCSGAPFPLPTHSVLVPLEVATLNLHAAKVPAGMVMLSCPTYVTVVVWAAVVAGRLPKLVVDVDVMLVDDVSLAPTASV